MCAQSRLDLSHFSSSSLITTPIIQPRYIQHCKIVCGHNSQTKIRNVDHINEMVHLVWAELRMKTLANNASDCKHAKRRTFMLCNYRDLFHKRTILPLLLISLPPLITSETSLCHSYGPDRCAYCSTFYEVHRPSL